MTNTVLFSGSIRTYGLVIKANNSETGDRRIWVRFPQEAETLCSPLAILHGTSALKSSSVHLHVRFPIASLSIFSFFLEFHPWRSRTDRVLTLNMNIRLPLFWSTWSRARGSDLATSGPHVRAWRICVIIAIVWLLSKSA